MNSRLLLLLKRNVCRRSHFRATISSILDQEYLQVSECFLEVTTSETEPTCLMIMMLRFEYFIVFSSQVFYLRFCLFHENREVFIYNVSNL